MSFSRNTLILWNHGEALIITDDEYSEKYAGMYCIDYFSDNPKQRFGKFNPKEGNSPAWTHIPFEEFPAEFRTALLLLGVQP